MICTDAFLPCKSATCTVADTVADTNALDIRQISFLHQTRIEIVLACVYFQTKGCALWYCGQHPQCAPSAGLANNRNPDLYTRTHVYVGTSFCAGFHRLRPRQKVKKISSRRSERDDLRSLTRTSWRTSPPPIIHSPTIQPLLLPTTTIYHWCC